MKPQFDELLKYADEHLADVPVAKLLGDNEEKGMQIEHPFLTNILDFSFLYVATGEKKYLDAAKRWTLCLAAMDEWDGKVVPANEEGDRSLYTGFGLTALSAAYDWLYGDLTDAERALVRAKIASRCEAIYRATSRGEWWTGGYLHHDLWIPVGGMGLGAVAIMSEVPAAREWAAATEEQFAQAFRRLGDDGAWHEGPCGWAFAMASFVPFWDASSRLAPSQFDESRWLQETWRFRLYSRNADGTFIAFGDGRPDGHYQQTAHEAAPTLLFVAKKFANPYAAWLAGEEWNARPNPYTAVWEIIWADPTVAPKPPFDLPASALFANEGLAIMRTGWHIEDTAAALHCDSLVGRVAAAFNDVDSEGEDRMNIAVDHTHADANSLAVWARGGFALRNAGYGQRDTQFQNSLLVDGKGQYRSFDRKSRPATPNGVIKRFFASRFASFVEGDAARCYPPGLSEFSRSAYLVRPGVVFIVDDVAAGNDALFEWPFHVPPDSAVTTGIAGFRAKLENVETVLRLATPLVMTPSASRDRTNVAIKLTAPKKTRRMSFVAAVLPTYPVGLASPVNSPTEHSFVIETTEATVFAAFSDGGNLEVPGKVKGNGLAAIVSSGPDGTGFLAVDAEKLSIGDDAVLAAPLPVTVSCYVSGDKGQLTVSSPQPTQVAVDPGMSVKDVIGADGRSAPYLAEGPRIILSVPEGTSAYDLIAGESRGVEGN
jgi:hypothetical protein